MTAAITLRDAYEIKELFCSWILQREARHATWQGERGGGGAGGGHVGRSAQHACSPKGLGSWERERSPGQVPSLGLGCSIQVKGLRGFHWCL